MSDMPSQPMKRKVFLAIPQINVLGNTMCSKTWYEHRDHSNLAVVEISYRFGDSLIDRVRARQLHDFMESDATFYAHISGDMEILHDPVNDNLFDHCIAMMDCHPHIQWFSALYAPSMEGSRQKITTCLLDGTAYARDVGAIEVRWPSGGFWFMRRSVVEKMRERYPTLLYNDESGRKIWDLYDEMRIEIPTPTEGTKIKKLSEDWSFAERWRLLGEKCYADTHILIGHWGMKCFKAY